jgi:HAMP domain-containing protein
MSDSSATDPTTSVAAPTEPGVAKPVDEAGAAASGTAAAETAAAGTAAAKPPQRPVSEIRADIEKERGELSGSFARLREELDEAADAGRARASRSGKRVKLAAPVVAGAVATLVVVRSVVRRRSRR